MEERRYESLDECIWHGVLTNGLHIYVDVRPEYRKQFAFFAARYGGMDLRFREKDCQWRETPAGVAHFLEHKMFDTKDGSALQRMAANGVDPNAFTAASITGYYFEGTQGFEENLRTLLSFVSVPWFTPESVEKEQGIIAQEIRMVEDDPDNEVYYQLMRGLYRDNPIRVQVAGTVDSIREITAETLYVCHRAFYTPKNMVLCVAGNVDPVRVEAIAQEVLPAGGGPVMETDFGPTECEEVFQSVQECTMEVSAPLFQLGFKGVPPAPGKDGRQRLLGSLVSDVLFGCSGPLYARLYGNGLINNSFAGGYEAECSCAFLTAGGESREPERVLNEVLAEAERIGRDGIDPDLWERLKKAAYGSMVRSLNSLEDTCVELAQAHFVGEDFLDFPELFREVTKEEAEEMIRLWCVRPRTSLSVIRPKEA